MTFAARRKISEDSALFDMVALRGNRRATCVLRKRLIWQNGDEKKRGPVSPLFNRDDFARVSCLPTIMLFFEPGDDIANCFRSWRSGAHHRDGRRAKEPNKRPVHLSAERVARCSQVAAYRLPCAE